MKKRVFIFFLVIIFFKVSCAHKVRIISIPSGAQIKVNGKNLGKAPLLLAERSGTIGRTYKFEATLEGYSKIKKREPVKICTTPANLIFDSLLVGLLFGFCLKDEYIYDFTRQKKATLKSIKRPDSLVDTNANSIR